MSYHTVAYSSNLPGGRSGADQQLGENGAEVLQILKVHAPLQHFLYIVAECDTYIVNGYYCTVKENTWLLYGRCQILSHTEAVRFLSFS